MNTDFILIPEHAAIIRDILDIRLRSEWLGPLCTDTNEPKIVVLFTKNASVNEKFSLLTLISKENKKADSALHKKSSAPDESFYIGKVVKRSLEIWIQSSGEESTFNACVTIIRSISSELADKLVENKKFLKSLENTDNSSSSYSFLESNFVFDPEVPIGDGAFGKVFRVHHKADKKFYALKYFGLLEDEEDRESAVLASLAPHPNVIRYYLSWEESETLKYSNPYITPGPEKFIFIQMEHGGDLRQWLNSGNVRNKKDKSDIMSQTIEALIHIHGHTPYPIIHRDVKPENIFLQRVEATGRILTKLGDFGLARHIDKTQMTSRLGTTYYKAPELRKRGLREYDSSVDIYSTGKIFYELCAGLNLGADKQRWTRHMEAVEDLDFDEGFEKEFPSETKMIKLMLAETPAERPSATEVRGYLLNRMPSDTSLTGESALRNQRFLIWLNLTSLFVSIGLSALLAYFFIIPYVQLKEYADARMEISSKISQIQISILALEETVDSSDLKNKILQLNSELTQLKLKHLEQEKTIEDEKQLAAETVLKGSELESKLSLLVAETKNNCGRNPVVDSLTIGRWMIEVDKGSYLPDALIIRDTVSAGDNRYAFPVGGNSDMYTSGTGGEISVKKIIFPIRWSIGEESGSYLVFRDRGTVTDNRYAMTANTNRDI